MTRMAILGLGLMGGSLGLAVKRRGLARTVSGYARRAATRAQAIESGLADEVYDEPAAAAHGADLVVLCTSVGSIPDLASACRAALGPGGVLTDIGSCKAELVRRIEAGYPRGPVPFIGGHPIAGSEANGLEAASPTLYENAVVVLTPTRRTAPAARDRVERFWTRLGARVVCMAPSLHDRRLARTSHLPHLAAALLAGCVGRRQPDLLGLFCGTGFQDSTRVAEGNPVLWRDIIEANRTALLRELGAYGQGLGRLQRLLARGDSAGLERFLSASRARRRALLERGAPRP